MENPDEAQVHEIGRRTYVVADVQPLDVTGIRTIGAGSLLFLVAAVALLPFLDRLQEADRVWWLWTCLTGFGLGLFGVGYCVRRSRHQDRHQDRRTGPEAR